MDFTLQEEYMVQVCSTVKERICDTTFEIDMNTRDDFQCTNLEYEHCEDAESVLNDVTCKKTVEFQCRKEKRVDGGYGKETVCERVPKENCYDTPRTVRNVLCRPQSQRYCQKFSNPSPLPLEKQNFTSSPRRCASCRRGAGLGRLSVTATLRTAPRSPGSCVTPSRPRNSSPTVQ